MEVSDSYCSCTNGPNGPWPVVIYEDVESSCRTRYRHQPRYRGVCPACWHLPGLAPGHIQTATPTAQLPGNAFYAVDAFRNAVHAVESAGAAAGSQ